MKSTERVPVLIVGGGGGRPDGLVLLRTYGVESLLVSAAGEDGLAWCEAAREAAAARGIELSAVRVGHVEGDWLDRGFRSCPCAGSGGAARSWCVRIASSAWRSMATSADRRARSARRDRVLARVSP
jgi:2,4-dichlorophenol 6-monooxygenase